MLETHISTAGQQASLAYLTRLLTIVSECYNCLGFCFLLGNPHSNYEGVWGVTWRAVIWMEI